MAGCPIELPQCKRKIMTCFTPYEKKQCPLNVKPRCALVPPGCPLLPERNVCGISLLQNPGRGAEVEKCPAKTKCPLTPAGCPLSMDGTRRELANTGEKPQNAPCANAPAYVYDNYKIPKFPPYPCKLNNYPNMKTANPEKNPQYCGENGKTQYQNKAVPKCNISSNRRPVPCSECILYEFSSNKGKGQPCPYLKIPEMCHRNCDCPEVPDINVTPSCPFLPKPCPCCTTPRCPLTKKTSLTPQCTLLNPPCTCGVNCLGERCAPIPFLGSCDPPKCKLSNFCGTCVVPCSLKPSTCLCLCGLCPAGQATCPLNPCKCVCGVCPPGRKACPLNPCKSVCGLCPPVRAGCPLKPCKSICGLCPPVQVACLCGACLPDKTTCPLNPSKCLCGTCLDNCVKCPLAVLKCYPNLRCLCGSCPLSSPPCVTTSCQCCSTSCPLIPPPCSLSKDDVDFQAPKETFHVPICPKYKPPCKIHLGRSINGCPFAPNPCPLGPPCPYPIGAQRGRAEDVKNRDPETPQANQMDLENECPGSSKCGIVPAATCPAAEVLRPEIYIKKQKIKEKPCPFKECMRKPECPLSSAMPNIDCPKAEISECPLAKEPDCPVAELASKFCPCSITPCSPNPLGCTPCSPVPLYCALTPEINCPLAPNTPITKCPVEEKISPLSPTPNYCLTMPNTLQIKNQTNPSKKLGIIEPPKMRGPNPDITSPQSECEISKCILPQINRKCKPSDTLKTDGMTAKKEIDTSITLSDPQSDTSECVLRKLRSRSKHPPSRELKSDGITTKYGTIPDIIPSKPECPLEAFMPKETCPLAPPPCPMTPKPPCPLMKKPDPCPLSLTKCNCPIGYPPCAKFPEGRCPMGDLNLCDCDYPVCPCLVPPQLVDVTAPPQYCVKDNCCMGLPLPPVLEKVKEPGQLISPSQETIYCKFMEKKPGKEDTKYYVKILRQPPTTNIGLFSKPPKRLHNNWKIIKGGEGFKRCKMIATKLENMGDHKNVSVQYTEKDCPIDEETRVVIENRKKNALAQKEIEMLKFNLGLK